MVATALPGQHKGFGAFVTDHDSEDYLKAVDDYSPKNRVQARHSLVPMAVSAAKLAGVGGGIWSALDTTGLKNVAIEATLAGAQFLRTGAETLLATLL